MDVRVGLWRKLSAEELMLLNCGVGEDSWESLGLQGDPTSPFWRRSALGFLWNEWCWSWNSSTLATSCKELTHWKRLWCWEGLGARGQGDDRGWDGWMASPTWWTWVWVNSGSWWWTGRPVMLQFMGSQRVGHDWVTELNWTDEAIAIFVAGQMQHGKKANCVLVSSWKELWSHEHWNDLGSLWFSWWRSKWQPTPVSLPGESHGGIEREKLSYWPLFILSFYLQDLTFPHKTTTTVSIKPT